MLSRTKAAEDPAKKQEAIEKQKKKLPELEEFIQKRDYSGAIALLEVAHHLFLVYFNKLFHDLSKKKHLEVFEKYWPSCTAYRTMDRFLRVSYGRLSKSQTCN